MVSVFISSVIDRGFGNRYGQTKDYTMDISCFSKMHPALRSKGNDLLAQNQDDVPGCQSDMLTRGLLFT
jgi:hypothetical protein